MQASVKLGYLFMALIYCRFPCFEFISMHVFVFILVSLVSFSYSHSVEAAFEKDITPNFDTLSTTDFAQLCEVAQNTQEYLIENGSDDYAVHGGYKLLGFSNTERIQKTLAFICQVHQQDSSQNKLSRLSTPEFLKKHFDFYRWLPDQVMAQKIADKSTNKRKSQMLRAIPKDKIFLTKYYTKLLNGSDKQTAEYNQALYALPFDEQGLSLEQAEQLKHELVRYKYSRQQIINGALLDKTSNNSIAKPLVWISEEALHDVLLQGTGVLSINGEYRYYNVHRNNGIAYDYSLGKSEQARYWYFSQVPSILGYGRSLESKVSIKPYVTFAGNVQQLGLGQLILVSNNNEANEKFNFTRLGVLADEGGAFTNNLFQLDYLVGSYYGWKDYHQKNKHLPDYTKAWLLLLKDKE